jgi:hypothetical protein
VRNEALSRESVYDERTGKRCEAVKVCNEPVAKVRRMRKDGAMCEEIAAAVGAPRSVG